ncbi:MAG: two-component response regulator VirG [Bradyrhizobium sp.]|nr:two-component response regulator VirG [Bradyrhizobium sp.]
MLADCGYVVVVDDDLSLRQMVIKYPEGNNVTTKSVQTGQSSIAHFAGAPSSLIILDLRLGQDDGLDLLRVRYRHGE